MLILLLLSLLLGFIGTPKPFAPMPVLLVVIAWKISYPFILVMPITYLVEYQLLSSKSFFGNLVLGSTILIASLSVYYFWGSWDYGVKYQGETHTIIVAIINAIVLIGVGALAFKGIKKKSARIQKIANLLLFIMLTWCAFPYLGELP